VKIKSRNNFREFTIFFCKVETPFKINARFKC
jgi:hypothetical protein